MSEPTQEQRLIDALCICNCGISNDAQRARYLAAHELIYRRAQQIHLQADRDAIDAQLAKLATP